MTTRFVHCALLLALPVTAGAQSADGPTDFGTSDEGILVVGWEKFFPLSGDYASDVVDGGRWATGPETRLAAPIDGIPNGAVLTQVVFYYFDNDAGPSSPAGSAGAGRIPARAATPERPVRST